MPGKVYLATVGRAMRWASGNSLWYMSTGSTCCADELMNAVGCKYDLERFGCVRQPDPAQADLLVVTGMVSKKAAPHLRGLYDAMMSPKFVMAVGTCANSGGLFSPEFSYSAISGLEELLPVDVYVPGCPPRPEAILNGLIRLQDKIRGHESASRKN